MTTVGEWLASREPSPPPALRERVLAALGDGAWADRRETAPRCLAAGEALLATLLRDDRSTRTCALDLLAADALVTYAFEAAAESPADLAARASAAMGRIAALGTSADGASDT